MGSVCMSKTESLRIVGIGSNLESQIALEGLIGHPVPVAALVTLPPHGSENVCDYVDLHAFCEQHAIEAIDTTNINSPQTLERLRQIRPDYVFTLGWSQIFSPELLAIPSGYIVGSHLAPLPEGRGRAPVPWTILQGISRTAMSLFRMNPGVDSGDILLQKWFDVAPDAYAMDVYLRAAECLRDGYCELYDRLAQGEVISPIAQDPSRASHRAKRVPADGHLDFHRSSEQLYRLIRAASRPYPGAYTYYKGRKVIVWKARLSDLPSYVGVPGQILHRGSQGLLVQCGDGPLWLSEWQLGANAGQMKFVVGHKFGYALEDEINALHRELEELRKRLES